MERMLCKCKRCGHTWLSRKKAHDIKTCPNQKCHSPYWNSERKRNIKKAANRIKSLR